MRKLSFLLAAVLLLQPLPAAAEEELIMPPCETMLYYSVGTVNIHFDQNCNGGTLTLSRLQPEGEFIYYTYDPRLISEAQMRCELIEGDYKLEITLPSPDNSGYISYPPFSFTIADPDMDETQSFDRTQVDLFITADAQAEEHTLVTEDAILANRIIYEEQQLTLARRSFLSGDMMQDGKVDAADAAALLVLASQLGSGEAVSLSAMEEIEADVNGDGNIDAADAADVLMYSAACAADGFSGDIADYLKQNRILG